MQFFNLIVNSSTAFGLNKKLGFFNIKYENKVISDFKKYITNTNIFCIFINKFNYLKELNSIIIWFMIDKNLEINFY